MTDDAPNLDNIFNNPPQEAPTRVALYARVSTKKKGQDPEVQLRELRTMAERRGWTVVEEYVDHETGKTTDREALDRLLAEAAKTPEERGFDVIAFWRLDRFGRSRAHLIETLDWLERQGIKFVSHKDGDFDTTTATGRLVVRILAVLAQFESELIGERISAGMASAKERGHRLGRTPKPVDMHAVSELLALGWGTRRIARALGVSPQTIRRRIKAAEISTESPTETATETEGES